MAAEPYVAQFHPRLIGLTGTPEQILAVAESYKAYYAKYPPPDASPYRLRCQSGMRLSIFWGISVGGNQCHRLSETARGHLTQPAVPRGRYSTTIFTSLPDLSRSPGSSPLSTRKRST